MTFMEFFAQFVGIQGILGLLLVGGYIFMVANGMTVPNAYENLMLIIVGFYFAKNGTNMLNRMRGR